MALFPSLAKKKVFYNKLHKGTLAILGIFSVYSLFILSTVLFRFIYNFRSWQNMQIMKEEMAADILKEDQDKAEREFEKLLVIPEQYAYLVDEYNRKMDERRKAEVESV